MHLWAGHSHNLGKSFRRAAWILGLASAVTGCATGSPKVAPGVTPVPESRLFETASKRFVTFNEFANALLQSNVVFFGEQHDDPATHRAELAVLAALGSARGGVVLSLEMFERDVQPVVDAYMAGQIPEGELLAKGRPWERYAPDYRALVELARARGWRVVAANVPRRLAAAVSRSGLSALDSLSAPERGQVARDIACPHDRYFDRFAEEMKGHSAGSGPGAAPDSTTAAAMTERFYQAQCIKDETMAESIAAALSGAAPHTILLHVTGAFHTDLGLGTAARVHRRVPNVKTIVISAIPVDDPTHADPASFAERGDYIVLTRKTPPVKP